MKGHRLLHFVRTHHGDPLESLDAYFEQSKHEAWSLLRQHSRSDPGIIDEVALEVVVRRRAEMPGAFFALLLDVAAKDEERRAAMIALFRKHLPELPAGAMGAAGYNLHEFNFLLDTQWIADAKTHFDADPEGAWGIVESAAMYRPHVLTPSDVDWFETKRERLPRDYYVVLLSLASHWEDRRAEYLSRVLDRFDEAPSAAVEAAAFAACDDENLLTPGLVAAVVRHLEANAEKAWEFFDGASRSKPAIFDDVLLDVLAPRGPGSIFGILRHLMTVFPERQSVLLDRYAAAMRRYPKEGIERGRYAFERHDIKMLRPDHVEAVRDGFAAAPYAAYELLWHCVDDRPELVGLPEVEAALRNIPNATNRAFGFFTHLLKKRPEFTKECTLAVFECLAEEPAYRAFNRAEFVSTIVAISEASHIKTGLEKALREPPKVGSRRARALMAIMFREKLRSRRHVLMEALRYAGGIVLWHKVGEESQKFSPVWDFFFFIIDNAADDAISTAAAERFLEGAFQLHYLCETGAEHEEFLRKLDTVEVTSRPFPAGTEFLAADAELARLWAIVTSLAERFGVQPNPAPFEAFAKRLEAAEVERRVVAEKKIEARVKSLDKQIGFLKDPDYGRAFNDAEAEKRLGDEARAFLRREKKDLAKNVRDALRAESVRIALWAVEHSRLGLYRERLKEILGHDVDIDSVEPKILPSFLWFQAVRGMRSNAKYLKRMIEDRIANRGHEWLRTEPPAVSWAAKVTAANPAAKLDRWRAPFSKEFVYRPKDANAEKRRRIKTDLAQARELLEKAGVKPASETYDELKAKLMEAQAGVEDEKKEMPAKPVDRAMLAEVAMNLERVRLVEQTPESDFEGKIVLTVEHDPFEILFMGEYGFASCLSLRGSNAWSAVSNAVDVDKTIVWAREPAGNVVARRLLALMPEGIVQFHTYTNRHGLALDPFFDQFIGEYARHVGVALARGEHHPGPLLSDKWYDDGAL
jgi:hypothetical protein